MPSNPIKTGTKPDGSKYYYFRIEAGRGPDGERKQIYKSFGLLKDAKAEFAKLTHSVNDRTHVAPAKLTLDEYLDSYVVGHVRDLEESSKRNLRDALRPARERLGHRKLQSIQKGDIDALVDWMATSGRKRGGKPGTGLGPRTIKLTLGSLSGALDMAVRERRIAMNPCLLVKKPKAAKPTHVLWSDEEQAKFFDYVKDDRLATVIDVFALGLRPEELCGLRWSHLDLDAKPAAAKGEESKVNTICVGKVVRTHVTGVGAVEKAAKTEAGDRELPLDDGLIVALKAWLRTQKTEQLAAGGAYSKGSLGGYVLCDEIGEPFDPPKLRRKMYSLMKAAKVERVTPYEAMRHAAATRLANAGVPPHQIAAWLGHANASFTMDTYVQKRPQDLVSARDVLAAR